MSVSLCDKGRGGETGKWKLGLGGRATGSADLVPLPEWGTAECHSIDVALAKLNPKAPPPLRTRKPPDVF